MLDELGLPPTCIAWVSQRTTREKERERESQDKTKSNSLIATGPATTPIGYMLHALAHSSEKPAVIDHTLPTPAL